MTVANSIIPDTTSITHLSRGFNGFARTFKALSKLKGGLVKTGAAISTHYTTISGSPMIDVPITITLCILEDIILSTLEKSFGIKSVKSTGLLDSLKEGWKGLVELKQIGEDGITWFQKEYDITIDINLWASNDKLDAPLALENNNLSNNTSSDILIEQDSIDLIGQESYLSFNIDYIS